MTRRATGGRVAPWSSGRSAIVLLTAVTLVLFVVPAAAADDLVEFSFSDPAGDAVFAPDVVDVDGTWSPDGPLVLDIGFGNVTDVFGESQYVTVGFDTDFDGLGEFLFLSTGFGGTRICEPDPDGEPNVFVCVFDGSRVTGELVGAELHIEFFDTELLGDAFQLHVSGANEEPREFDFAGRWTVARVDDTPPEIRVAVDPITVWPTRPEGNDALEYGSFVRAVDLIDPDPVLVCDPPSGSLLPIGETLVTCTATDDAGNSSTRSFTVIVLGPVEVVGVIRDQVAGSDARSAPGLAAILERAAAHFEDGREGPGCALLDAFIAASSAMSRNGRTGVPEWWTSSVVNLSERVLECDARAFEDTAAGGVG